MHDVYAYFSFKVRQTTKNFLKYEQIWNNWPWDFWFKPCNELDIHSITQILALVVHELEVQYIFWSIKPVSSPHHNDLYHRFFGKQ